MKRHSVFLCILLRLCKLRIIIRKNNICKNRSIILFLYALSFNFDQIKYKKPWLHEETSLKEH